MRNKYLAAIAICILSSAVLLAQPANNLCSNATSLGSPTLFTQVCDAGTNVGATAEFPYPFISGGCIGNASGTSRPSADVWYVINTPAGTNSLYIDFTSSLDTMNIALYTGVCGNLSAINCGVNTNGGNFQDTLDNVFPNTQLYIQISGGDELDQSAFNLCITPTQLAGNCATQYNLIASPPPLNGTYSPGQTVQFCYTLIQYQALSANWFHALLLDFGAGWDISTLTPISSAATCDFTSFGFWGFYNAVTSSASGLTNGPGFFFDTGFDGNPGNNFGDNCTFGNWQFCWEITVPNLPCGSIPPDLSMNVQPFGDGVTGAWGSPACGNDPIGTIVSVVSCCTQPTVNVTDAICASACTGTANIAGTSQAPFTYAWAHGPTDSNLTGLCPGTYTVTVTDFNNCVVVTSVNIGAGAGLITLMDSTNVSCTGANDGEAWVTPTNGTGPYTYNWNPAGTSGTTPDTIVNLSAGVYSVTVTDALGCVDTNSVNVIEPVTLGARTFTDSVSCNGAGDGIAWSQGLGATPPFSYAWSTTPTQFNDTVFNLTAGSYTVTITDGGGCSITRTVTIYEPSALQITTDSDSVSCNGADDGQAWVTASGGNTPFTYSWSTTPVQNTDTAFNLPPGTYTVTVTDASGCSVVSAPIDIFEPAPVTIQTAFDSVTCAANNDGRAWTLLTGAPGPIAYNWNTTPAQATDTATGLAAGIYDVTVTDANGCTYFGSVDVLTKTPMALAGFSDSVTCGSSANGKAWVEVTNGVAPYGYSWSAGTPVPTGDTITGVTAGSYTVTVTDAAGCVDSVTISVLLQANPNIVIDADSASCALALDGRAWATASGGAGGFTYQWSSSPPQFTDTMSGVRAGFYSVTATDAAGCQDTANVLIGEPLEILTATTGTDASCNGAVDGSAFVTVTNPVGGFTAIWSAGTLTNATGDTVTGLAAGTYYVTVTDGGGCDAIDSVLIGEPVALSLANQVVDSVSCFGGADGRIYVEIAGGTAPYSYTWTGGTPVGNGDTVTGLLAGSYDLQVLDANNCVLNVNGIVVDEPTQLVLSVVIDSVSCNGGSDGGIDLTVTGGVAPYSYLWTTGAITEDITNVPATAAIGVTVTDANGCTASLNGLDVEEPVALTLVMDAASASCNTAANGGAWATAGGGVGPYTYLWNTTPAQNTDTAFGLSSGTYTVTATDFNNCTIVDSVAVVLPTPITFTAGSDSVSCNGGSDGTAWVIAAGGAGGFTYQWNTTPPQNTDTATGLIAGTYSVTLTDANLCTATTTVNVGEPAALSSTIVIQDVTCSGANDGAINLTVTGGASGYFYEWTDPSSPLTVNSQDLVNVTAGTYSVIYTDANGCQDSITNIQVVEADSMVLTSVADSVDCANANTGSIDLTVTGGTPVFQYNWSNAFAGQDPTNLPDGIYTVVVTDANGCTATLTDTVSEPTPMALSFTMDSASCYGVADGAIDITVTGGVPQYTYNWSNAQTTEDLTNIAAGSYSVTATDANGCDFDQLFINVRQPDSLNSTIALNTDSLSCDENNLLNGLIEQQVTGGISPYTYIWSNGETTRNATDLNSFGSFQVTVTDARGCMDTSGIVLNPYEPYVATLAVDSASCYGDEDGSAQLTITGGLAPFTFEWTGFTQTGRRLDDLPAGDYVVIINDALGCDTTINFTITEQPEMEVDLADSILIPYAVDTTLPVSFTGVRAIDSVIYAWLPDEGLSCADCPNPVVNNTRPVWYTLTMDVNGCVYTDSIYVTIDDLERPFYVPNAFSPNGDGTNDVFQVYAKSVRSLNYTIHNRWGQMVFRGADMSDTWDGMIGGKEAEQAVYVVDGTLIFLDGTSRRFSQSLMLLR